MNIGNNLPRSYDMVDPTSLELPSDLKTLSRKRAAGACVTSIPIPGPPFEGGRMDR